MVSERIKNPINLFSFLLWSMAALFIFVIALVWICIDYGFDWFAVIICAIPSTLFFIIIPCKIDIIDRPREVEVIESGIILYLRMGRKKMFVPWSGITAVNHAPFNSDTNRSNEQNSFLRIKGEIRYTVTGKIAEVIRDKYRTQLGQYPLNQRI